MTRARSLASAKVTVRSDSAAGARRAAEAPGAARATNSMASFCATPPSTDAARSRSSRLRRDPLRPRSSVIRPPRSSSPLRPGGAREGPLEIGDRDVEVSLDRRQCDRDGRGVEEDHQLCDDDGGKRLEATRGGFCGEHSSHIRKPVSILIKPRGPVDDTRKFKYTWRYRVPTVTLTS